MVPDTSQWRNEAAYDYLDHIPPAGFAWEWLRRNPRYQRDYAELLRQDRDTHNLEEMTQRRWGLRFRDETGSLLARATCHLVSGEPQWRGAARRDTP